MSECELLRVTKGFFLLTASVVQGPFRVFSTHQEGAGEVAQWLKALVDLAGGVIFSIRMMAYKNL